MNIDANVREVQAQARYSVLKGTPESEATKSERALVAPTTDTALFTQASTSSDTCAYCHIKRHTIRQCRRLQKDLRDGTVKDGTVLQANFELHGSETHRSHPYDRNHSRPGRRRGPW